MAGAAVADFGLGLGWRPETALLMATRADLTFSEVIAENIAPHQPVPRALANLIAAGKPVVAHGIGLSLGSADGIKPAHIDRLARVAEKLQAPLVSEHIAFVRADGLEAGHLLPVKRTRPMLDIIVANVKQAQAILPVPLALENIAALFAWPEQEGEETLSEEDFIGELLARTDAGLVLDLANLYANQRNHGWDALAFLDRIPRKRIAYCHIAGGIMKGGIYHDTHAHPVTEPVAALATEIRSRIDVPILLERDRNFGTRAQLEAELDLIAHAIAVGDRKRHARKVQGCTDKETHIAA